MGFFQLAKKKSQEVEGTTGWLSMERKLKTKFYSDCHAIGEFKIGSYI